MSDIVFAVALAPVVHPLDDVPEQKLYRPELGRMRMTLQVRIALFSLQAYLAGMVILLGWRLFTAL
jgi:hypothetical protein